MEEIFKFCVLFTIFLIPATQIGILLQFKALLVPKNALVALKLALPALVRWGDGTDWRADDKSQLR